MWIFKPTEQSRCWIDYIPSASQFPAICGIRIFITMFARPMTLDLALSQMYPVHSLAPYFSGHTSPFGL